MHQKTTTQTTTQTTTTQKMEGITYEEPKGLDEIAGVAPASSLSVGIATGNPTLVEIRFIDPTKKREHMFVARRSLIEAHFPGLGGCFQPQRDATTDTLFFEVVIPYLPKDKDSMALYLAYKGEDVEEVYRYYEHYLVGSGKLPDFSGVVSRSKSLKDVPGATDYELNMFRNETPADVEHLLNIVSAARYFGHKNNNPCRAFGSLALANIFDAKPIDDAMRLLRLDGKEYEMTPEEMEDIIAKNSELFNSWLTPPKPLHVEQSSSSSSSSAAKLNDDTERIPIVELD